MSIATLACDPAPYRNRPHLRTFQLRGDMSDLSIAAPVHLSQRQARTVGADPPPQGALLLGVLMQQARALQQSTGCDEYRVRRVMVEPRLARLAQLGSRRSRYFGRASTKFQLYLAAKVANLVLVAGRSGLLAGTGSGSNSWGTARIEAISSAFHYLAAPFARILTPARFPDLPIAPSIITTGESCRNLSKAVARWPI